MTGREDPRLQRYAAFLLERNRSLNLTGARDDAAVWEHIDDSLTLAPHVRDPHVDIGSGGGFPGIPLAIVCGVRVTLIESTAKKARFLEEAAGELGIAVTVLTVRAEDAGRDPRHREQYASASARAVASAPTILELAAPLLRLDGLALLQRGKISDRERSALADAALVLGMEVGEEVSQAGAEEKRLIIARKHAPIGVRFPRRAGIPQKRPLCMDDTL